MNQAARVIDRYRRDPVAFCVDVLRFTPWSKQAQVIESVRDTSRTAVRSCHGAGKTAIAARTALWFLATHARSRVITTGPTFAQVRDLLWREIAVGHRASQGFIGGELLDTRLEIDTDWFAIGLSTDQPERFQGHHAEDLLLVVDEASGVSQEIFDAASGFLTAPGARLLLVGNPTRTSGEFFSAFNSAAAFYSCIQISAFDTPAFTGEAVAPGVLEKLVSRQWVEEHLARWGERSPLYEVRVLAQFPSQTDDAVVPLGNLQGAQGRELEPGLLPLVVACDVARFGSDDTVIAVRAGNVARIARAFGGRDTMQTVGAVLAVARELQREQGRSPTIVVDDAGVGGGVTDRLREIAEFKTIDYLGARKARAPRDYPNRRSEDWFALAEALPLIDIPPDPDLVADLLAPRYLLDSQARRVVETKSETKRRLRRSPDRGDALVMAFSVEPRPGKRPPRPARISVPRGRIDRHRSRAFASNAAATGATVGVPITEGRDELAALLGKGRPQDPIGPTAGSRARRRS